MLSDAALADLVCSTRQMSTLLSLSGMHLGRLEKSGYVKRIAPGRWRLVDTLQGYVRSLRESRRHNNSDAARRLYELRAKKLELDNACRERSLIPLDDACYAVDIICGLFRSELSALPMRCSRRLDEQQKLETEINGLLSRVSDMLTKQVEILKNGK